MGGCIINVVDDYIKLMVFKEVVFGDDCLFVVIN